jgi:ribosomal protein S18 acetylase RimI-like enzyme
MIYYTDGRSKPCLNKKEVKEMSEIMSDAFMNHENWRHVIRNEKKRKKTLTNMFYFLNGVINHYGHTVVVQKEHKNVGYITYMENADKTQISLYRIIKSGVLIHTLKFILGLNLNELISMNGFNQTVKRFYSLHKLEENGLHLYNTGINPNYKGQGIMKKAFNYADSLFLDMNYNSIFLETSDQTNIGLYEHLGFNMFEELEMYRSERKLYYFIKRL